MGDLLEFLNSAVYTDNAICDFSILSITLMISIRGGHGVESRKMDFSDEFSLQEKT